jgi:repressor LexA
VVEQRDEARDGETVVALLDGESVTVRTYERAGDNVRLRSKRDGLGVLEVPASRCRVQGVVVGVLRRFA